MANSIPDDATIDDVLIDYQAHLQAEHPELYEAQLKLSSN